MEDGGKEEEGRMENGGKEEEGRKARRTVCNDLIRLHIFIAGFFY